MSELPEISPAAAAPRPRRRRVAAWLCGVVGGVYALYAGGMWGVQDWMVFPGADWTGPPNRAPEPPDGVDSIEWSAHDGTPIRAWYQRGRGRSADHPGPAMMYFHGNGDRVSSRWSNARPYIAAGVSALFVEYRGYDGAAGRPSEAALVADGVAGFDWLAARPEVRADLVILHGLSLGGAVAAGVAAERRPSALILEATFFSMTRLAGERWLPSFLLRNRFDSATALSSCDAPVLIFHGRADTLIPIDHARDLHARLSNSEFVELDHPHHLWRTDWRRIMTFLAAQGIVTTAEARVGAAAVR